MKSKDVFVTRDERIPTARDYGHQASWPFSGLKRWLSGGIATIGLFT
jgi:hypothetical protein